MQELVRKLVSEQKHWYKNGSVANYIPELAKASPSHVGLYLINKKGRHYYAGNYDQYFTIQSMAKPLALLLALMDSGEAAVFEKVGYEPTGDPFNSLIRLETARSHKPYNPMVNVGTLTIYSLIRGHSGLEKFERIFDLIKTLAGNSNLLCDQSVYLSEKNTGDRNRAMGFFLRDIGIVNEDIEELVDIHFRVSSILVTCREVASIAFILANHGIDPLTGKTIVAPRLTQIVNAIMMTCGMYDEAGEFAVRVGLPAKSGVSGGIMCVVPKQMGVGIYAPALDEKGNSIVGVKLLESLSTELSLSIF